MTSHTSPTKGFTLIELLIALAVAAIILSVATPSFRDAIQNNRMTTQINELHASLSHARSEAIKRNENVAVCKSSNGTNCTGDWDEGWIVFVDDNSNDEFDVGEPILLVHGAVAGNINISFGEDRVIYASDGLVKAGSDSNGTFTLCDDRGATSAKALIISPSGRPGMAIDSDDSGVLNDADDADLVCSS